jgi:hypothetical protein
MSSIHLDDTLLKAPRFDDKYHSLTGTFNQLNMNYHYDENGIYKAQVYTIRGTSVNDGNIKVRYYNGTTWSDTTITSTNSAEYPKVSVASNGALTVVWKDGNEIILREYKFNGSVWVWETPATAAAGVSLRGLQVERLSNGDSYVFWAEYNSTSNVKLVRHDGSSFYTIVTATTLTASDGHYPDTLRGTVLGSGNILLVWPYNNSGMKLHHVTFDPVNSSVGTPSSITPTNTSSNPYPFYLGNNGSSIYISWNPSSGFSTRHFMKWSGTTFGSEETLNYTGHLNLNGCIDAATVVGTGGCSMPFPAAPLGPVKGYSPSAKGLLPNIFNSADSIFTPLGTFQGIQ